MLISEFLKVFIGIMLRMTPTIPDGKKQAKRHKQNKVYYQEDYMQMRILESLTLGTKINWQRLDTGHGHEQLDR